MRKLLDVALLLLTVAGFAGILGHLVAPDSPAEFEEWQRRENEIVVQAACHIHARFKRDAEFEPAPASTPPPDCHVPPDLADEPQACCTPPRGTGASPSSR